MPITPVQTPSRLAVSTWSLHRTLGDPAFYGPEADRIPLNTHQRGALALLELPRRIAEAGIHALEICHFHLPSTDGAYLHQLRVAADEAGVELWNLLIDAGDVTDPEHSRRDEAWIADWIRVAGTLGTKRVRVIAGKQPPTPDTLAHSAAALVRLADVAEPLGIRVLTENWFETTSTPDAVHTILQATHGRIGLLFDFGNWKGPGKFADLRHIAPYAESCHCKPPFLADGSLDTDDYTRCFDITRAVGFSGPYSLIYDGPRDDEFAGLAAEKAVAQKYVL
jgi:sugar phosphate isomerase/epimerase